MFHRRSVIPSRRSRRADLALAGVRARGRRRVACGLVVAAASVLAVAGIGASPAVAAGEMCLDVATRQAGYTCENANSWTEYVMTSPVYTVKPGQIDAYVASVDCPSSTRWDRLSNTRYNLGSGWRIPTGVEIRALTTHYGLDISMNARPVTDGVSGITLPRAGHFGGFWLPVHRYQIILHCV